MTFLGYKVDFNSGVFYTLLSKFWSVLSGPITSFVIAIYFTSVYQGYFYTFNTLLSLQIFIELGLGSVIQFFASHEWGNLYLNKENRIEGDYNSLNRLRSLARISFKWFFWGGVIAALIISIIGFYFFTTNATNGAHVNWKIPWLVLSVLTGLNLMLTPFWAILEGCNQVKKVYSFRFIQGMLFTMTLWISIIFKAGLWAACFASSASLVVSFFFIFKKHFYFFFDLFIEKSFGPAVIQWQKDILPMQWKVAVSWVSNYFAFYLFIPILFKFQGAEIAGKFGMSWNIALALGSFSSSWVIANTPKFGMLISQENYIELDRLLWKMFKITSFTLILLSLLFMGFVWVFKNFNFFYIHRLISRLLDPFALCFLFAGQYFFFISTPFSTYLRAHKKEPLLGFNLVIGISVSICTYLLAKFYSVNAVTVGYFIISILGFPWLLLIWSRFRGSLIQSNQ